MEPTRLPNQILHHKLRGRNDPLVGEEKDGWTVDEDGTGKSLSHEVKIMMNWLSIISEEI